MTLPQLKQWDSRSAPAEYLNTFYGYFCAFSQTDTPAVAVEQRHGWLVPPAWEFVSEVWECEGKPVPETVYDHENEVGIIV